MIEIFRVTGAFGIHGAMRAVSFSGALSSYRKVYDKSGNAFSFRVVRFFGGNKVIVSFDVVNDRDTAESLKSSCFYVKKTDLPQLDKNEVYLCDLIGKEVRVTNSDIRCKIVNILNFGAGDLIEILYEEDSFFVPFTVENFPDSENHVLMTLEAFNGFKN